MQQSPFRGDDEEEIYDAVLTDEPLFPTYMQQDSISILKRLLARQPESRLGSGPTGALEVMSHLFFRNINWEDVYNKRLPVPFVPEVKDRIDTSNSNYEFTSTKPALTPVHSGKYNHTGNSWEIVLTKRISTLRYLAEKLPRFLVHFKFDGEVEKLKTI